MSNESEKIPVEIANPKDVIYSEKDKVGSGSIGSVFKGQCRGFSVAVKVPNKPKNTSKFSEEFLESFRQEVKILSRIYHPRIVLFMGAYISPKSMLLVTELLDGNIQEKILKTEVSLFQKAVWIKQTAEGMAWLHGSDIIHGDLKPSNLLYHSKTHSLKISDFGVMSMKHTISGNDLGETLLYTSPEGRNKKVMTKGEDVYSFGKIVYFFVTGKHPKLDDKSVLPTDEHVCPKVLRTLAEECLNSEESKRPSFEDMLKRFDEILINCAILCDEGRKFWTKYFINNGTLQLEPTWQAFMKAFSGYLNNPQIMITQNVEYIVLKKLLYEGSGTVSLGHFGQILGFFEAFAKEGWLEKVLEITSKEWFWGQLSGGESQKILAEKQNGSALVRFSSTGSNSVVSYRQDDKIWHTRVIHPYASNIYQIPEIVVNTNFNSMDDLLVEFKKKANIKQFCEGSPYPEISASKKKNTKTPVPSGYAALEYAEEDN